MKKPTCLILVGIGVLLLIGVLVFVVPIFVEMFQEMQQMSEKHTEYKRTLRQYANEPLTAEQEKLLSQLLEVAGETSDSQNPQDLETLLSTEPYLAYLRTQDRGDYADFPAYVAAMPTLTHRNVVLARLKEFLGTEVEPAEQEIWVDYYYIIRDWSKTGKDVLDNQKEFDELLQTHLVKPIMNQASGTKGLTTKIVKMGIISTFLIEENEVFHHAWRSRISRYGTQEGYLRCAIATPTEFALMRSFFEDAATFEKWMTEPFRVEEDTEGQENK
ncbi:hypothetical protein C6501_13315 [Candidatus Poribacteria bacterium]|nr:MAG: hypothetical protein C6501_13315 [Candidatus Poribacteria bacterium]